MARALRTLRALGLVPVFAALAALAVALASWGLLHTRYGQEQLRRATERELRAALPQAAVRVPGASFSITGEVVLRDVGLWLDGLPAVSVAELRVEIDLRALLSRQLRLPLIHIVEPVVDARLDLTRLAPRLAAASRFGVTVVVDRVAVEGGTVLLPGATLDDVHVESTVDLDRRLVRLASGTARWRERGLDLGVTGWLRERDGVWLAGGARARVSGAEAELELGSYDPRTGAVAATGRVRVPAERLLAIAGDALPAAARGWRGDIDAEATAVREDPAAGWELSLAGAVGAAPFAARGRIDAAGVRGRLRVAAARPSELYEGAPEGEVTALLSYAPRVATVVARGTVAGVEARRFAARAEGGWSAGSVVADLTDDAGVVHAELRAARGADGVLVVSDARLQGDVSALVGRFAALPVRALAVDLRAAGPATDLLVTGAVEVEGARYGTTRAAVARATVRIPHVSLTERAPRLAGFVDATAGGLEIAGRRVGRARAVGQFSDNARRLAVDVVCDDLGVAEQLRAEVVVDRGARDTSLRLGRVDAITGDLVWSGRGGRVVVADSGRVQIDDVDLASAAGAVQVHGVLAAPRARHAEGRLRAELHGFDLARGAPALARIAGVERPLAGSVDAELTIERRGAALGVEAVAELRGFVWRPGAAALDGSLEVSLGDGWLSATARAAPRDSPGELRAEVEAIAPVDTLDARGWRELDLDAIDRAELVVDGVEVETIAAVLGQPVPFTGTVDGTVALVEGAARAFELDVGIGGLAAWRVEDLALRFRGRWDERRLSGSVALAQAGEAVAEGSVAVDWGFDELWRRRLVELGDAEVRVYASVGGFDLRRVARERLVEHDVAGWLDADIEVSGPLTRPRVVVSRARVAQLAVAGVEVPRVALAGAWQGELLDFRLRAEQATGGAVELVGSVDWSAEPRVAGTVTARTFDLRALRAFAVGGAGVLADVEGELDAELTVDGPAGLPKLRGAARARGLGLSLEGGTRRVEDGTLSLRFAGYRVSIEQLAASTGRGRVSATGTLNLASRTFELDAAIADVPVVVRSYVAAVDADGTYSGRWIRGGLDTRAELRSATVRLADTGRELQDIGPLADVVYVDRIGGPGRSDVGAVVEDAIPLQVRLVSLAPVRVTSPEVEASIDVDLTLRYQGILHYLEGDVVVERGRFRLFDRYYQIATATARLDGRMPIDPELEIELRRTFPYALVSIFVGDRLSDPRIVLGSDNPDYSDEQILAIIVGQDPEATGAARGSGARAGGIAANVIVGRIVRDAMGLPIDIVRAHPDGYEVGKYLFRGAVLVGYRQRTTEVIDKNRNEGTIEWRVRRDVIVEGSYGDANVGAADVLYVIRF